MIDALFTTLAAFAALLLVLALMLLIPGLSYPVVSLAKLSQAPGGSLTPLPRCSLDVVQWRVTLLQYQLDRSSFAGVTVLGTVSVMLGALLASSVLELRNQPKARLEGLDSHHRRCR